ncbi:hypothetical protein H4R33_002204 [Dimargaris cristalligena]|nr:hypothetical protein H4R33_002204 [Dimargaris cristalligena]
MSNIFTRAEYLGYTVNHEGTFCQRSDGTYLLFHAKGSKATGFQYTVDKKDALYDESATYVQGSERELGRFNDDDYHKIVQQLSELYVDTQVKSVSDAMKSTWNCRSWVSTAIPVITQYGCDKQTMGDK